MSWMARSIKKHFGLHADNGAVIKFAARILLAGYSRKQVLFLPRKNAKI